MLLFKIFSIFAKILNNMKEVDRKDYIDWLLRKRGNGLIKIITGVRRCGKSYLLFKLFRRKLIESGVDEDHIIALALDDFSNKKYHNPEELYNYVKNRIKDEEKYYILLDEIQLVDDFVSVLNGFLHISNVDVYVTGSNSRFLSSDIITEFRGRGDEIRIYPFSFAEISNISDFDKEKLWTMYCRYGGMPLVWSMDFDDERESYLKNLFEQVYLSDIINRYKLKGHDEIGVLTNVLASSIGSLTNPQRLANTFQSSSNLKLSQFTISSYIDYLIDSFLIERVHRFDVKGRKYIGTPMKYYFVDVGLRNARLNFRQQEENHIMENIIYNELLRRRYSVDVGVVPVNEKQENKYVKKQLEIDFIANKGDKRYYIQSAYEISNEEKIRQELQSFRNVDDSFKKIIIQRIPTKPWYNEQGVLYMSIMDFLLNPDSLEI